MEKRLREEEGKNRHDIGRDALVKRIWDWKDQYEARIIEQLRQMGCSCDFERTRFTLDDGCSQAVRNTFFKLFRDGHIIRGKRLVNWDCELQTAVADDEVTHETVQGKFYHFRYPLKDSDAHVTIATTRPETMLGDTAVAVNPEDARYRDIVGQTVILPLLEREIPIIADEWADPEKGSGCVKITPAHDPNDYEVGLRRELPMINVLNADGTINDNGGPYAGMDRFAAREAVVRDLEERGLVEKIEDREHDVGHSDRSKTPVEPYLSDQWFVRMVDIAEPTLEAVRDGRVKFHPDRYKNSYLDWLGEKRDWCISRQLWWGHRIPVWTCCVGDGDDDAAIRGGLRGSAGGRLPQGVRRGGRPHPRGVPDDRRRRPRRPARAGRLRPRRGRARYLVQFGAVATQHAGLARVDGRTRLLLSDERADHLARHHHAVGGAHGPDRLVQHGRQALRPRVHPPEDPRRPRRDHEQVQGQRRRSAGHRRGLRRRRPALRPGRHDHRDTGHPHAGELPVSALPQADAADDQEHVHQGRQTPAGCCRASTARRSSPRAGPTSPSRPRSGCR